MLSGWSTISVAQVDCWFPSTHLGWSQFENTGYLQRPLWIWEGLQFTNQAFYRDQDQRTRDKLVSLHPISWHSILVKVSGCMECLIMDVTDTEFPFWQHEQGRRLLSEQVIQASYLNPEGRKEGPL
jgi:hypothetical protein